MFDSIRIITIKNWIRRSYNIKDNQLKNTKLLDYENRDLICSIQI